MYFTTYLLYVIFNFPQQLQHSKKSRLKNIYQISDELFPLTTTATTYSLDRVCQGLARAMTNRIQVVGTRGAWGMGDDRPLPDFVRYVNPISIREQIMPTTLLLALPSLRFKDLPTVLEWKR